MSNTRLAQLVPEVPYTDN